MRKIILLTAVIGILVLGIFTAARAQSGWEWIDTGFDYILYDMSFPEGQSEIGYAVGSTVTYNGDGIIIKTTDGGFTWEQISESDLPGLEAVFFTDLNTGYAGGWDNYFIKTTDGGETWTEIAINPDIWYFNDIEFWDDNNGIATAWGGLVFVTDDAGDSWTQATGVNIGIHKLDYATSSVVYAVGGDEKIIKSTDGGLSWSEIYSGTFQYVFLGVNFIDEDFGVVGGEDGKVMVTEDGGDSWTSYPTSYYHLWRGIYIFNPDSIYVAGTPEGIYKTTDGGDTWVDAYPESNYDVAFYEIIFTADNNTGFICGSQGTFLRKEGPPAAPQAGVDSEEVYFPQTWVGDTVGWEVTVTNYGNAVLNVTDISSDNAAFFAESSTFDINPGGEQSFTVNFAPDAEGLFEGILTIECNDPVNPVFEITLQGEGLMQQAVISVASEIIFDSTLIDNTTTKILEVWNIGNATLEVTGVNVSGNAFEADMTSFSVEPGAYQGIEVSFTPDAQGAYSETLEIVSNDSGSPAVVALSGYGELGTGIFTKNENVNLSAYPNPFENNINVSYPSGSTETENLVIYNMLGGFVMEVSPNVSQDGTVKYNWDGRNLSGEAVPSGIYFGVLRTPESEKSIKLIKK